jgi:hypothetical protein
MEKPSIEMLGNCPVTQLATWYETLLTLGKNIAGDFFPCQELLRRLVLPSGFVFGLFGRSVFLFLSSKTTVFLNSHLKLTF